MKRSGIIHAELARRLAALRHTDTFVICDAGLPLAPETPCVDLGYRYGQPGFADVAAAVLGEVVVEHNWVSRDVVAANPLVHQQVLDLVGQPELLEHEEFKARARAVAFAVRTGEATFFANLLCRSGVAFPAPAGPGRGPG